MFQRDAAVRVLLGIPTAGAPASPFLESLAHLRIPADITAFDRYVVTGNFVPGQRELIVKRAFELRADILVMCDDDMVIPSDAVAALVDVLRERPRCALAGALYYSRDGFRPMAVTHWDPHNTTSATIPAFENTPVAVDGVGFGCIAMRMDAVAELEAPYFPAHVYIESDAARVRVCNEDYLFCNRLRSRGWEIVLHAGVRCGHYDRASGDTHPMKWEDREVTSFERIAVLEDGMPRLIRARELPAGEERHRPANVTYVWPER